MVRADVALGHQLVLVGAADTARPAAGNALRAPSWLAEHNTLRAWLPVALVLLLPAATLLTAVPLYRAYQIPAVDVGFPLEEFDRPPTPSEQALDGLYELAYKNFVDFETFCKETKRPYDEEESPWYKRRSLTPAHVAWIDFNQEAIAKALAASRSDDSVYVAVDRQDRAWDFDVWRLARLVILSGVRLEEQGNLDAAIDRYLAAVRMSRQLRRFSDDNGWEADDIEAKVYRWLPYWAARPRQTPAQIIAAARRLDELASRLPPDADAVKFQYVRLRRVLLGGYAAMVGEYRGGGGEELLPLTYLWSHLPWERTRAVRLLGVLTRRELDQLAKVQAETARRGHTAASLSVLL